MPRSRRLAVMTVSGGAGVLMADAAEREGVELTPLSAESQAEVLGWVPFAAARNPVDLTAQPLNEPELIDKGLELLLGREGFPAIAAFFLLWATSPKMGENLFESISSAAARYPDRYFALSVIAGEEVRRRYEEAGIAIFEDPWRAVEGVAAAMRCAERLGVPPLSAPPRLEGLPPLPKVRIDEDKAKRILADAGIPAVEEHLATSSAEAAAAAKALGDRLVLKILSPDILHKTEAGGVMLDIEAQDVADAYDRLLANVRERAPQARIDGVLVSPMLRDGIETIIGVQNDPVFGPVVMFGLGGIFVEIMRDVTFRIAPFGVDEARRMISEIKSAAILDGARGKPPADIDALAAAISQLSRFAAAQQGQFTSIEINSLLVRPRGLGVTALDALISTAGE
ncbi:MAG TPA: acetate--CoA ligase family protein [Stellaceae bacterium]|nr:acetate--CoA ligase family protein [Stellaceae bacterium]